MAQSTYALNLMAEVGSPMRRDLEMLFYRFYESKALPQTEQYAKDYAEVIRKFQAKWEKELKERTIP